MRNLEAYYRDEQDWSAGPHLFVADDLIWVFTPLRTSWVHSPSWDGDLRKRRGGIAFCRVGGCNPLHYELEQISKTEIPRKTKTTLRRHNHQGRSLPGWLKIGDSSAVLLYKAKYLLLQLQHGSGRVVSNS